MDHHQERKHDEKPNYSQKDGERKNEQFPTLMSLVHFFNKIKSLP